MHDRAGALGRVYDFVSRAIQDFVIVGLHPNAYAFARETRQTIPSFTRSKPPKSRKGYGSNGLRECQDSIQRRNPRHPVILSVFSFKEAPQHIVRRSGIRMRFHGPTGTALRQATYFIRIVEHALQRHEHLDDPQPATGEELL